MIFSKNLVAALVIAFISGASGVAQAAPEVANTPGDELHKNPAKRGWFWYLSEEEKKPEPVQEPPLEVEAPEEKKAPMVIISKPAEEPAVELTKEELCNEMGTWTSSCGFIDPGQNFEFQAKQRDILLQLMALTPENPDAVEAAQQYMKWVVGKASMAANMWYFNMVQNPDLDPTVKNPISSVGLALATKVTKATSFEYYRTIKEEGGILFYFTRNDCSYCHDQTEYTIRVAETMGLPLINVPLDGVCMPEFYDLTCADNIPQEQIAILDVKVVPSLYLYVPTQTWIRLGSGVMTDDRILANTVNFFSAYRAAMLNGLDNGNGVRPSVTFDPKLNAPATGTASASGDSTPPGLEKSRLMKLMGY